MEPKFPLEFIVYGTPVSLQNQNARGREECKALVWSASLPHLPNNHFATAQPLAITLFYFPEDVMVGDVDNIVKLVVDALDKHIYQNDRQIERVVVQKFERDRPVTFTNPSRILTECMLGPKPALHIRITDEIGCSIRRLASPRGMILSKRVGDNERFAGLPRAQ